jgi:hypothetical protein
LFMTWSMSWQHTRLLCGCAVHRTPAQQAGMLPWHWPRHERRRYIIITVVLTKYKNGSLMMVPKWTETCRSDLGIFYCFNIPVILWLCASLWNNKSALILLMHGTNMKIKINIYFTFPPKIHKTTKNLIQFHLRMPRIKRVLRLLKCEQYNKFLVQNLEMTPSFTATVALPKILLCKSQRTTLSYQQKGWHSLWSSAMWYHIIRNPWRRKQRIPPKRWYLPGYTASHPEFHNLNTHNRGNEIFHKSEVLSHALMA